MRKTCSVRTGVIMALLLVALSASLPVASATAQNHFDGPWDNLRVERVFEARGAFATPDSLPEFTFSEILVLQGAQATCTFTITCNSDGTFDADIDNCTGTQVRKIFEAAQDIC